METPLLLKILLSWAIMIFCFTALFAASHNVNKENFDENSDKEDNEETEINDSIEPRLDIKSKEKNSKSGGSVLNVSHRDKH